MKRIMTLVIALGLSASIGSQAQENSGKPSYDKNNPVRPTVEKINLEGNTNMEQKSDQADPLSAIIDPVEKQYSALYNMSALTNWYASVSGSDQDFEKAAQADMALNVFLADTKTFETIKQLKDKSDISNPMLKRRITLLYNAMASCQTDTALLNQITLLQNSINKKFQNFRANVNGIMITDNDVEKILSESKDSKELEAAWKGHKEIGPIVSEDLIKLVELRNKVATNLGYQNYHDMSLRLSEQDPKDIMQIFDKLDDLIAPSFKELKAEIDESLSKKYGVKPEDLMPWHYQNRFFQEAPKIYEINLDKYYDNKDLVELTTVYYEGIGLDTRDIVSRSDLFEKKGKNQHAFCTDIDRDAKDVRVLCNVKPNAQWMNTMLHEFGHAVYTKYHDEKLPWVVKTAAHTFTTEAIAMMFGRLSTNSEWMKSELHLDNAEAAKIAETCTKYLRLEQLCFSRWAQVMFRFESAMYDNPRQDLNKVWWDLVEKYQLLKKPEGRNNPDWATKIHIALFPCYYHNYQLGELLASQLYYKIKEKYSENPTAEVYGMTNNKEIGQYLRDNVFGPGATYPWNEMIKRATGENLNPMYYVRQFTGKKK